MFTNYKIVAAALLLGVAMAAPGFAQAAPSPAPSPSPAPTPAPIPYFTTTLHGKAPWTVVLEMAIGNNQTSSALAEKRAMAAPVQGMEQRVDVEITTVQSAPGKPGAALVTLPGLALQFTAPTKVVIVPQASLPAAMRSRNGLLLGAPKSVRYYGFGIGVANFFGVGVPVTPAAAGAALGAPALAMPSTAIFDISVLDPAGEGLVIFGEASQ